MAHLTPAIATLQQFCRSFLRSRGPILFTVMAIGASLQIGHSYTALIKYTLMVMLFTSLLGCRISWRSLGQPGLARIPGMMALIAIIGAGLLRPLHPDLALVALLLALTPTAIAAPVVTRLLNGRVEYVMASVILTNGLVAVLLPLVLPLMNDGGVKASPGEMLRATLMVIIVPLVASQLVRSRLPRVATRLNQCKPIAFYLWLSSLYLASAKAGYFITQEADGPSTVISIAAVAMVLCAVNFGTGRWMGRRHQLIQETGQSLGQKNTLFSVWICLTFLSPQLALGPMFYILFQNLFNAYLMARDSNR